MPNNRPFPINPVLTGVAISYQNRQLIADQVLPYVNVGAEEFKYRLWTLADGITLPDTKVGRKGVPTEVEFGFTETPAVTSDYGLDDVIPQKDMENGQAAGYDPKAKATEWITNLLMLDREVRVASTVFTAGSYATANKSTLAGATQWSDDTSDPIGAILTAKDGMIVQPNIAVTGQQVWRELSTHPKVVSAVLGNNGTYGVVTPQQVATLLGLDALYVGQAFVNSAKKGQTVTTARAWGKFFALIHRDSLADAGNGTTFGFTARVGDRFAADWFEPKTGLRGSTRVRVGESVKEVITANDLGYLFSAAIA